MKDTIDCQMMSYNVISILSNDVLIKESNRLLKLYTFRTKTWMLPVSSTQNSSVTPVECADVRQFFQFFQAPTKTQ